jgi:hypothetical protein
MDSWLKAAFLKAGQALASALFSLPAGHVELAWRFELKMNCCMPLLSCNRA